MDQSSQVPCADAQTVESGYLSHVDNNEQHNGSYANGTRDKMKDNLRSSFPANDGESIPRADERSGRVVQTTVDVAEIIRRWTHALQRIHKQSLHLVCCFLLWTEVIYFK